MSEKIPLGKCPRDGIVYGDDIEFNFPNPAICSCGMELETCTVAEQEEIQAYEQEAS